MRKILIIKSVVTTVFAGVTIVAAFFALRPQIAGSPAEKVNEDFTGAGNCVSCHQQAVESRRKAHSSGFEFEQTENDAASRSVRNCAECHGEASKHVRAALSPETSVSWQSDENLDRRIIQPQKLDSDHSMLICASCHGSQAPAQDKQTQETLLTLDFSETPFWADGSPRLTGREYQGIINSPCFLGSKSAGHNALSGEKINCLTCHTMHESSPDRIKPEMRTNLACTQCHEQFTETANLQNHTQHALGSNASNCFSCHLPQVVYGETAFQQTHQISIPEPELTALRDVPNACNQCHVDQSVNWAIAATKKLWAGYANSQIIQNEQFNQPEAIRMLFLGDPLERALAAENLRKYAAPEYAAPFLAESFATDSFPIVRFFAANALVSADQSLPKPDYLAAPEIRQNQIRLWFDKFDLSKLSAAKILAGRFRRSRKNILSEGVE